MRNIKHFYSQNACDKTAGRAGGAFLLHFLLPGLLFPPSSKKNKQKKNLWQLCFLMLGLKFSHYLCYSVYDHTTCSLIYFDIVPQITNIFVNKNKGWTNFPKLDFQLTCPQQNNVMVQSFQHKISCTILRNRWDDCSECRTKYCTLLCCHLLLSILSL